MRRTNRKSVLLALALTALLVVIAASALAVWSKARDSQSRVAALQKAHMDAGLALAAIRANVYVSAILTRDYLLDSDPSHAEQYARQFRAIRSVTEKKFATLASSSLDESQKPALRQLHEGVSDYWDPTELVLEWSPAEKLAQRSEMLGQRVRRREEIFVLADKVENLVTHNFDNERRRITTADQEFRTYVGATTGIALLLGFAIAGGTLMRMLTLEKQSQNAEAELRLLSGQIRTAQEQERRYLSRELHDQVGQMLTGLRLELGAIARIHGEPESEVSSRIAQAKGTVEQTLQIVRNVAMLLRPSMLDDLGLAPALAWLVKDVSRSSGVEIQCAIEPEIDALPDKCRTCIYRLVQEALTNIARHSAAHRASVTLKRSGDSLVGSVADDGRGFDSGAARNRGLGRIGMEERVREIGGSLHLESSPGRGTRVEFRIPFPECQEDTVDQGSDRRRSRDSSKGLEASA